MTRPRIHISVCGFGPNGVVVKCHMKLLVLNNIPEPFGMWRPGLGYRLPPASTSSTETPGSADNRLASTHPAEPAPAIM